MKGHRTFDYQWALASFMLTVIVLLAMTVTLGREQRGKSFLREAAT